MGRKIVSYLEVILKHLLNGPFSTYEVQGEAGILLLSGGSFTASISSKDNRVKIQLQRKRQDLLWRIYIQ